MVITKEEYRNKVKEAVNRIADVVKLTAGAEGKSIIIENSMDLTPHPTKDGVTVLNNIYGKDSYEEVAVKLLKEAANKTVNLVGDGTTQTVILAQALINNLLNSDANQIVLREGLELAHKETVELLKKLKKKVTSKDKLSIATIASNNDKEIGKLVSDIFKKVDTTATVEVREGYFKEDKVTFNEGIMLDRGWALPHFVTDDKKMECVFEDAYLLLYNAKLEKVEDILEYLQQAKEDGKPLVILADDCEGQVMEYLINLVRFNELKVCICMSPQYGLHREQLMQDLAFVTDGEVFSKNFSEKAVLGEISKFIATNQKGIVVTKYKEKVEERVAYIKETVVDSNNIEKQLLDNRIANLTSSVVEITVGGVTDLEIKERKDRIEDAIPALRNAILDGCVAGGGATLNYISSQLNSSDNPGYLAFKEAVKEPMKTILDNASIEFDGVVEYGFGYNVLTRQYTNLLEEGILDPVSVIKTALENAVSVSKTALNSDGIVLVKPILI